MKTAQKMKAPNYMDAQKNEYQADSTKIERLISEAWNNIAPTWPLKNLIAANPLAGLEHLSFEEAMIQGDAYFRQKELPLPMHNVNRQTIKWLQAFFDHGQATIKMPLRHLGLFRATRSFLTFDNQITPKDPQKNAWLTNLPSDPQRVISECLIFLGVPHDKQEQFLTLQLTTLAGWAAYIKYRTDWPDAADSKSQHSVTQADYLALRLVLTCLIWPQAKAMLGWHDECLKKSDARKTVEDIAANEKAYRTTLLEKLSILPDAEKKRASAQLVFCIDVRSEPFRKALEQQGNYETFGFAGFFGLPVSIENSITGDVHASCPVLLKPAYTVREVPTSNHVECQKIHDRNTGLKKLYQSLKYTFTTPFVLVEGLGVFSGILMAWRNFFPGSYQSLKEKTDLSADFTPQLERIPLKDQVSFALGALRTMGLTENFAPVVVFCGHGGETKNNAYATALDCGACGGHHGAPNARILAAILNSTGVRQSIEEQGIKIPTDTHFIAAEHNTTTDEVTLYRNDTSDKQSDRLTSLQESLDKARDYNSLWRAGEMGKALEISKASAHTLFRAKDWAQARPEWGLARNAAFIVGPRALTKSVNLEGRSFLHSYDWKTDKDGSALTVIMTAPMVVAQWINTQYLFSTLDNVAYGGGSKISKNITGKVGIMQGNASDLMHGLPLQSVYKNDNEAYHQPLRLMTIIYAPRTMIDRIIKKHDILIKLFGNGWVSLACIEPETGEKFMLERDFSWKKHS